MSGDVKSGDLKTWLFVKGLKNGETGSAAAERRGRSWEHVLSFARVPVVAATAAADDGEEKASSLIKNNPPGGGKEVCSNRPKAASWSPEDTTPLLTIPPAPPAVNSDLRGWLVQRKIRKISEERNHRESNVLLNDWIRAREGGRVSAAGASSSSEEEEEEESDGSSDDIAPTWAEIMSAAADDVASKFSPFQLRRSLPLEPDSDVPDCMNCGATFTMLLRRHHCRRCGLLVCATCSPSRLPLLCHGHPNSSVRVCARCEQHAETENRWHSHVTAAAAGGPPAGDDGKQIGAVDASVAYLYSAYGCDCGSAQVVEDRILNFTGMAAHRVEVDRARAFLLTCGIKAQVHQAEKAKALIFLRTRGIVAVGLEDARLQQQKDILFERLQTTGINALKYPQSGGAPVETVLSISPENPTVLHWCKRSGFASGRRSTPIQTMKRTASKSIGANFKRPGSLVLSEVEDVCVGEASGVYGRGGGATGAQRVAHFLSLQTPMRTLDLELFQAEDCKLFVDAFRLLRFERLKSP